jgi:C4-dicarboxylate transporter, DctM subunit
VSGAEAVVLALVVFALLAALTEMNIGLALLFGAGTGIFVIGGFERVEAVFSSGPFRSASLYSLFVIPMYILLGSLIANSGIGQAIYRSINVLVVRVRGGLAATAVIATGIFSGVSGSSAADLAAFGRVSVAEMSRHGYAKGYAAAVVAASSAFAVMIPPSLGLVIYGILAEVSIGKMLVAGLIPGIASMIVLTLYVIASAYVKHHREAKQVEVAPARLVGVGAGGPVGAEADREVSAAEAALTQPFRASDLLALGQAGVLFLIVVGGLYSGLVTVTESAALGAAAALVITIVNPRYRTEGLWTTLKVSLRETSYYTSMIFLLLLGGAAFTYLVASSGVANDLANWMQGLDISTGLLLALILVALLVAGMFMDGMSLLLVSVPVLLSTLTALDVDLIWFGVLMVKMVEIGLITPPVGINVYILSSIVQIPPERIFRYVVPFVALDLALTTLFFVFPDLVMWPVSGVGT